MISVAEAQARILADLRPTPAEIVGLSEALGRVVAADVRARLTQPPADLSAMDGYAVKSADAEKGAILRLIGSAPAGHPFPGTLEHGQAVRIFTGSVIPQGADAVLIQEDAARDGECVHVRESVRPGRHIRRAGQDFRAGEVVIPKGKKLTPRDIGLAAAANHPWLFVHRRPRVAVLSTGDEIALPGEPIPEGGIVSSNAHALAALIRAGGGEPIVLPIARDDVGAIAEAANAAAGADLLVSTGGVSVGEHDLVQSGLSKLGFEVDFWRIAMRPGKPLMYGRMGETPVLGLPGNPVSALVCGLLFLWPLLLGLSGLAPEPPATTRARLGAPLGANDKRMDFLRARLSRAEDGSWVATAFPVQDSAMLKLLAEADCLILRPPHAPAAATGESVEVLRFAAFGL